MDITRDVISDLWPIYEAGEASADTRALVERFLTQDPAFAATLRQAVTLPATPPPVSRDAEARALQRTRNLVRGRAWLRGVRLFALAMTALAFGRIVEDTTFTAPPARFIGSAIVAAIAWLVYLVALERERHQALHHYPRTNP